MKDHPYTSMPDQAFWRRSVAEPAAGDVDPVAGTSIRINRDDKVVTAGSCFAQHIARHLKESGYHYLITEKSHPLVEKEAEAFSYGTYTARYGNVYTSRQLVQLLQRAYGAFVPMDAAWVDPAGRWVDAFRPTIQPDGFPSLVELEADRAQHFAAVRQAFESLDVFVFTLGLTECWGSKADRAVYPVCPGVSGGQFDADRYQFINLSVEDVVADLRHFIDLLRKVNPAARVILTVSPVPLAATASGAHVLTATTLSKSILRVAAEVVCSSCPDVHYFPSYEIVTGAHTRGQSYSNDLRSIAESAVSRVMSLFLKHATSEGAEPGIPASAAADSERDANESFLERMTRIVEVSCDEEALDPDNPR